MSANETYFDELAGIPTLYDRSAEFPYGSNGQPYRFYCNNQLKGTLERCFVELFQLWGLGIPEGILSAGTIGDGDKQHGRGLAFDLDGFVFPDGNFMMDQYPDRRSTYIGINAHLFLYFSQVLSYHYPLHHDHFHMDFNFSYRYRTASNAQTFFVQMVLVYIYKKDLGDYGLEEDGVDGIYGFTTKSVLKDVLKQIGLANRGGLTKPDVWSAFLNITRESAFSNVAFT